jgi:hypothetical protein
MMGQVLGCEALEIQRDPDPIGRAAAEIAMQLQRNLPANFVSSFRDGPKDQTRDLEIPGSMLTHRPGMTGQDKLTLVIL